MAEMSYFIYGGELGRDEFQIRLQMQGVNEDGAIVFADNQTGDEYPLTSNRIRQLQQDDLMVPTALFNENNTPIFDNAKQLADVVTQNEFPPQAVQNIKEAGKVLFKTQIRVLKEQ